MYLSLHDRVSVPSSVPKLQEEQEQDLEIRDAGHASQKKMGSTPACIFRSRPSLAKSETRTSKPNMYQNWSFILTNNKHMAFNAASFSEGLPYGRQSNDLHVGFN